MPVRSCTQFRKSGAIAVMQVRQVHAMSVCFVTAHSCLQFRNPDVIQGCAGGETGDSDIHDILRVKAERSETSVCQKAEVGKKRKVGIPTRLTKNKWVSTASWWLKVLHSQPFVVWVCMRELLPLIGPCSLTSSSLSVSHALLFLYQWRTSEMMIFFFDTSTWHDMTIYNLYLFTLEELSAYTTCARSFRLLSIYILFDSLDKKTPNTLSLLRTGVTVL